MTRLFVLALVLAGLALPAAWAAEPAPASGATAPDDDAIVVDKAAFAAWLADLRREALAEGISAATFDAAFAGLDLPFRRVLELDRVQPEFTQTLGTYLSRGVSDERVRRGREMLTRHAKLLRRIEAKYGVQARFLVAFWGLETNFGANFGGFPVVGALATLAQDSRRPAFFRGELMHALHILEAGHIAPDRMVGSWAGAMGHLQFMPSTFAGHAVDASGDGHIDIWGSLEDTFASAAHYLSDIGWKGDETWGREVLLPKDFDLERLGLDRPMPLAAWKALGLRRADGGPLPVVAGMTGALLLPAGIEGPAFLVYDNFRAIMTWNRSILYALAVGHLADRLIGLPPLAHPPPADDRPLARAEVVEIQTRLNRSGFDAGAVDGLPGGQTRQALQAFQRAVGTVADGHVDRDALDRLRGATP
jgi:membrane-bound lytic murein transglycosylase B